MGYWEDINYKVMQSKAKKKRQSYVPTSARALERASTTDGSDMTTHHENVGTGTAFDPFGQDSPPKATWDFPSRTSGGGGGGGGGYGGGVDSNKHLAGSLQSLLKSRAFKADGIDGLLNKSNTAVSADQATARSAYDQLAAQQPTTSAWDSLQLAEAPQVQPELLRLLAANGTDGRAYEAEVGLSNTQAAQAASASERLRQQMAAAASDSRSARSMANGQAGQFAQDQIGAQGSAMRFALEARQREEQKALDAQKMQVIMQLISAMAAQGQQVDVGSILGGV